MRVLGGAYKLGHSTVRGGTWQTMKLVSHEIYDWLIFRYIQCTNTECPLRLMMFAAGVEATTICFCDCGLESSWETVQQLNVLPEFCGCGYGCYCMHVYWHQHRHVPCRMSQESLPKHLYFVFLISRYFVTRIINIIAQELLNNGFQSPSPGKNHR